LWARLGKATVSKEDDLTYAALQSMPHITLLSAAVNAIRFNEKGDRFAPPASVAMSEVGYLWLGLIVLVTLLFPNLTLSFEASVADWVDLHVLSPIGDQVA